MATPKPVYYPENYTADPTGQQDAVSAFNAMFQAMQTENLNSPAVAICNGKYLISSGNLVVPAHCTLQGVYRGGLPPVYLNDDASDRGDYTGQPSTFLLSTTYTIILHEAAVLDGFFVTASGLKQPDGTARTSINTVNGFAGTAVTMGTPDATNRLPNVGLGAVVQNCFIIGFSQAIRSNFNDNIRIENVRGDCINGIRVNGSADITYFKNIEFSPYIGVVEEYPISSIASSNGLASITTSTPTNIKVGDIVNVGGVYGSAGPSGVTNTATVGGRYTVSSVPNASTIVLANSSYSGTYTLPNSTTYPGTLYLSQGGIRQGVAFDFHGTALSGGAIPQNDGTVAENLFAYGYDTTFLVGDGCNSAKFINCGSDSQAGYEERGTVDLSLQGSAHYPSFISFSSSSHGIQLQDTRTLVQNSPSHAFFVDCLLQNTPHSLQPSVMQLNASNGAFLHFIGGILGGPVEVGANAGAIHLVGVADYGVTFPGGTPANLRASGCIQFSNTAYGAILAAQDAQIGQSALLAPWLVQGGSGQLQFGQKYATAQGGPITLTLPALSAIGASVPSGASVRVSDVTGAAHNNPITIQASGTDKLLGVAGGTYVLSTSNQQVELVAFSNGWLLASVSHP